MAAEDEARFAAVAKKEGKAWYVVVINDTWYGECSVPRALSGHACHHRLSRPPPLPVSLHLPSDVLAASTSR